MERFKHWPQNFASFSVTEYDPMSCLQYKLTSSYDRMTDVGPVAPLRASEEGTSQGREAPPVDPARLLVKAWEDKVFPVIRRRFRSNTDRQSGLEQIKGALLAGRAYYWFLVVLQHVFGNVYCFRLSWLWSSGWLGFYGVFSLYSANFLRYEATFSKCS